MKAICFPPFACKALFECGRADEAQCNSMILDRKLDSKAADSKWHQQEISMSKLAKLTVRFVARTSKQDPVQQRRQKLVAGIEEQLQVTDAALKGESYEVPRKTWTRNEQGEKVLVDKLRRVRPWFFERDAGWYVSANTETRR